MRVMTGGIPNIPGASAHDKLTWSGQNDDQLRLLMLKEPRGYPAYCCNIIVPPSHPKADAALIIASGAVIDVPQLGRVTVDVDWGAYSTSSQMRDSSGAGVDPGAWRGNRAHFRDDQAGGA